MITTLTKSDQKTATLGGFADVCTYMSDKTWSRQPAPYLKPLPYSLTRIWAQGNGSWTDCRSSYLDYMIVNSLLQNYQNMATNKARDRFKNHMGYLSAGLGINLAQWQQSQSMIVRRTMQLYRAVRALKRGRFDYFAKELGISSNGRKRNRPREAGSLWLEHQFGWVPLIKDIHTSIDILQSQPPPVVCKGRGTIVFDETVRASSDFPKHRVQGLVRAHIQATVRVTNPNLYLANQLGLINPAAVLWDAVPFSFVVDWFLPVGKFLQSWTEFIGLTFEDAFTTITWRGGESSRGVYTWNGAPEFKRNTLTRVRRTMGMPSYKFIPKGTKGLSMWTAITSTALLVQQLKTLR